MDETILYKCIKYVETHKMVFPNFIFGNSCKQWTYPYVSKKHSTFMNFPNVIKNTLT